MEEKVITSDSMEDQVSNLCAYIEQLEGELESNSIHIDTTPVDGFTLDSEEFKRGLNDTSYICGQIAALVSVGVSIDGAFQYILSKEGIMYQELAE